MGKTMNLEQFTDCAKEMIPVLTEAREILKKYGCGKYLRMSIGENGYSCAEGDALGGWSMVQYDEGEPFSLKYEYTEKMTITGEIIKEEPEESEEKKEGEDD